MVKPIIMAFANKKGGVAKTSSVINIASILSLKGFKTLIIDLDLQGHASSILGYNIYSVNKGISDLFKNAMVNFKNVIKPTIIKNLFLIPADKNLDEINLILKRKINKISLLYEKMKDIDSTFDFIFLDFPPSMTLLTLNGFFYAGYVIIPFQTNYLSLEGIHVMIRLVYNINARLNPNLKVLSLLPVMCDLRTNMHFEVLNEVKNIFGKEMVLPIIRMDVNIAKMPKFKKPVILIDKNTHGTIDYINATKELLAKINSN